jgi:hypothetical protein
MCVANVKPPANGASYSWFWCKNSFVGKMAKTGYWKGAKSSQTCKFTFKRVWILSKQRKKSKLVEFKVKYGQKIPKKPAMAAKHANLY